MHSTLEEIILVSPPTSSAGRSPATSITGRISAHASTTPDKLAIAHGPAQLTFSDLEAKSSRLAAHLQSLGAAHETCVAIFVERSPEFVVAALAVLKSGAAYLPLDPYTPPDRIAFILSDACANLVITQPDKRKQLPTDGITAIVPNSSHQSPLLGDLGALPALSSAEGPALSNVEGADQPSSPETLAYVIYTSGSTGRPKGVEVTHANLLNLISWHQSAFNMTSADRVGHVAGLGFDATAWEIWPALTAGASLHVADDLTRRSPQTLRDWLVAEKITITFAPTVLAEQLIQSAWPADTALRTLLTGADTLRRRPAPGLPFTLINNYGPTECTVVTTSGEVTTSTTSEPSSAPEVNGPPSIGRPITNATVLILDENLHLVPTGEVGELCIAGPLVARGYRNNPELTNRSFVTYTPQSGPPLRIYRTGDRAKLLEHGEIAFLGRLDDQVKIRGYRIELGEIITTLDRYPGVEASTVIVRDSAQQTTMPSPSISPSPSLHLVSAGLGEGLPPRSQETPEPNLAGPQLIAYLIPSANTTLNACDLTDFLAQRLPDYMIPAVFATMPALPITPNGKIDKAALPTPTTQNTLVSRESASDLAQPQDPSSPLQPQIAAMVALLLGQPSIASDENFFMVGGHSMFGVQLVARIRDLFGVKLTLRQLFGSPTVTALTAEIERLTTTK
jgi:amino acid adenylation domain-containing protein